MRRSKSPTGAAYASNLTTSPGRRSGSGYIVASVDPASLKRVSKMLQSLEKKLADRIAKDALRKWGRQVVRAAKGFTHPASERTRRQITLKVKSYKRAVWAGVGVKTEKVRNDPKSRLGRYSPFVGWKSHFFEVGWRAWPRGLSGNSERVKVIVRNTQVAAGQGVKKTILATRNGKVHKRTITERAVTVSKGGSSGGGRGWKRGLRGRGGTLQTQYARHYLFRAAGVGRQLVQTLLIDAIASAITDAQKAAA